MAVASAGIGLPNFDQRVGYRMAVAVDLAAPADQVARSVAATTPEKPVTPIETQLSLMNDEAPPIGYAESSAEQVDVSAMPEAVRVEALEGEREILLETFGDGAHKTPQPY